MSLKITTTKDAIDALGGTKAVCSLIGVKEQAVSMWRTSNQFPAHTFTAIQEALLATGRTADISLWRFERKRAGDAA
jgi:DNA-binding transcriptional regulator YdaS (Cro superfamily)